MDSFSERITLFEDGVYRWYYDMDMWRNRYMIRLAIKVISLLMLLPMLLGVLSLLSRLPIVWGRELPGEMVMWLLGGDLQFLLIIGGLWLGMLLLAELVYAICALAMKGTYRLYFQMDENAVALVRKPGTMEKLNAFGAVASVVGLLAGKPGEALRVGSTLAVANNTGTSRFASTRRVKTVEKYDLLDLREFFGMNQIYVSKNDYENVRAFILERVPEKARRRSTK